MLTSSELWMLEMPRGSRPLSEGVSHPKWHWSGSVDGRPPESLTGHRPSCHVSLPEGLPDRRLLAFVSVRACLGFGEPNTEHRYLKERQRTYPKKEENKADCPDPQWVANMWPA